MRLATAINRAMSREPIGSDPIDMATIEAARGPRVAPGDIRSHRKTNTYRMCASGIIRAGVRIK